MTTVTIQPQNDAGTDNRPDLDVFTCLSFTGSLDPASSTTFNYIDSTANDRMLRFTGTGFTYDASDPSDVKITGGTVDRMESLDISGATTVISDWTGFGGSLNAADIYNAVVALRTDLGDHGWTDLFGAFDYAVNPSAGNLFFQGFGGNDTVVGGNGNDVFQDVFGGDADVFNGGAGQDTVRAGEGTSTLGGGAGLDTLQFELLNSGVTVNLANGHYAAIAASGVVVGFERVVGSSYDDGIRGNAAGKVLDGWYGDDVVNGGGANDTVIGGTGNDFLAGNAGNDLIVGGSDRDIMSGGAGADVFDFNFAFEIGAGATRDRITGFTHGVDKLDFATIDANSTVGGNQAFSFIGAALFTHAAGQLRVAPIDGGSNTLVLGDIDGNGTADFQLFMAGAIPLTAGDILL